MTEQPAGLWSIQSQNYQNWAGYAADTSGTGRAVSGAYGYFNVVAAALGPGIGTVGTWIGVGGKNGANLIQAGVANQYPERAWVELLPAQPVYYFNVNPGDEMYVDTNRDLGNGLWYVLVEDATTSTYYTNEYGYSPDTSTADWITEVQLHSGNAPGLSPHVGFSNATWTYTNSASLQMTSSYASTLWQITMYDPNGGKYCPSNVGSDGESFSISSC